MVAYVLLFGGLTSSPGISYTITILIALYPVFGPVITVLFLKDYRTYTLSKLRFNCIRSKNAVPSIFVSEMRTNPITAQSGQ